MNKGALALLVHGGTDNWSPVRWMKRFDDVCPDRRVVQMPDATFDPAEVHYAAVWKPKPGDLAAIPEPARHLQSRRRRRCADGGCLAARPAAGAGRGDDLTERMTEYVVLHALMHHRQELYLRESQRVKRWSPQPQWAASAITVGIMGLGALGAHAAGVLRQVGFQGRGLEPEPERDRRRPLLSRRAATGSVSAADRHPGLPAAADGGYAAHPQSRAVREAQPQQPDGRAGADQCRPRRPCRTKRTF